jgi:hypothetical protein
MWVINNSPGTIFYQIPSGKIMSAERDTGVIIYINEGKDMKVKPLYKSVNLRYLLFQSPGKRQKKT